MFNKLKYVLLAGAIGFSATMSFSQCKLVLNENFNNHSGDFQRYTSSMAKSDFGTITARSSGEIRGLDGPKKWRANNQVGKGVLRSNYPKNIAGGTNCGFLFDKRIPDTEEAVLEYKIKFEGTGKNNEFVWAAGGKLPGLAGSNKENGIPVGCTKSQSNIQNGFSCRLMWRKGGRLVVYTYLPDRTSNCGVDYPIANVSANKWYTVRQHIKLNSPGKSNGVLEMYINGKLALRKTNMKYRNSGKGNVKINDVIMHTYRGGKPDDKRFHSPNNDHIQFDDFKVWVDCSNPGNSNDEDNNNTTNKAPQVSFTKPGNGTSYKIGSSITANVSASDSDGDITKVELFINGSLIRVEKNAPYDWNHKDQDAALRNMSPGTYTLKAVATDDKGAKGEVSIEITINGTQNTNQSPKVSFALPSNGSSLKTGSSIVANVNATDADGTIVSVTLSLNGKAVRTEKVAPYDWNHKGQDDALKNLAVGTYTLLAVATDDKGAKGSSSITVTVMKDSDDTDTHNDVEVISGPSCAIQSGSVTLELTTSERSGANGFSWWFSGASSTQIASSQPYKTIFSFTKYFRGGTACVGYSKGGVYTKQCKEIKACSSRQAPAEVSVHPNPMEGNDITIESSEEVLQVVVTNGSGDEVFKSIDIQSGDEIRLENLSPGNYQMKVVTNLGVIHRHIVKL